jgi:hypothetical protein
LVDGGVLDGSEDGDESKQRELELTESLKEFLFTGAER